MQHVTISPPKTVNCLIKRAENIAGKTLRQLAEEFGVPLPYHLHHAKGWIGQLLEQVLGASAGNQDCPDFKELGIELKTLPTSTEGLPLESTYLCRIALPIQESDFYHSRAYSKLAKVLWVPIIVCDRSDISTRMVAPAVLWSPEGAILQSLQNDWEELTELMRLGHYENLSAHHGQYLQVRPKAASGKVLTQVINHQGQAISIVPKGFYLRSCLTRHILSTHYA